MFIVILVLFLMPWLSVSCGTVKVEVTGVEMVLGSNVSASGASQNQAPEPLAILAGVLAIAGLVSAFANLQLMAAINAFGTAGLLLALKFKVDRDLNAMLLASKTGTSRPTGADLVGLVQVHWEPGYWAAILACLVVGVVVLTLRMPPDPGDPRRWR
ncbi:MAG: hypothetical protein WC273_12845 [Dehalococcoidia bacterium]